MPQLSSLNKLGMRFSKKEKKENRSHHKNELHKVLSIKDKNTDYLQVLNQIITILMRKDHLLKSSQLLNFQIFLQQ